MCAQNLLKGFKMSSIVRVHVSGKGNCSILMPVAGEAGVG
ncbi:hypothetical protein LINPERHAP2_LOCUS3263 [Linum perenne]